MLLLVNKRYSFIDEFKILKGRPKFQNTDDIELDMNGCLEVLILQ
jgi:hypothetical protein